MSDQTHPLITVEQIEHQFYNTSIMQATFIDTKYIILAQVWFLEDLSEKYEHMLGTFNPEDFIMFKCTGNLIRIFSFEPYKASYAISLNPEQTHEIRVRYEISSDYPNYSSFVKFKDEETFLLAKLLYFSE